MTRTRLLPARGVILAVLLAMAVFGLSAPSPAAADASCRSSIGATTIDDNLRVPDNATCTLKGTRIKGNLLIGRGANLTADGIRVEGNIQDENQRAGKVTVRGSTIDGNIQLEGGRGAVLLEGNRVGGDIQPDSNTGGVTIKSNTVDGNLQCESNNPAPTGGGNVVKGDAEGQCRNLTGSGGGGGSAARKTSRLSGSNRFETSVAISKAQFPKGARVVYIARADAFADALAGGVLSDGPILLVPSCGDLPEVIRAEIRRLNPERVTALGGKGAVCDGILSAAARS